MALPTDPSAPPGPEPLSPLEISARDITENTNKFLDAMDISAAVGVETPAQTASISGPKWDTAEIDESHWNQAFPYQLMIIEKAGTVGYTRTEAVYTLPVPPQALTITTPFAITGSVTLGGYLEEHNGTPIRSINIQGTTGVLPLRGSPTTPQNPVSPSINAPSILAGTISAVAKTATSAIRVGSGTTPLWEPNVVTASDVQGTLKHTTGYWQFMTLRNFLEGYAKLKTTKDGKNFRLALAIWKDSEAYLVTPEVFSVQRSVTSPLEYNYTIQLKAWGRWALTDNPGATQYAPLPVVRDARALAQLTNRMLEARRTIVNLGGIIKGIRSDFDAVVLQPLRQVGLFLKDSVGMEMTMADLPLDIVQGARDAILGIDPSVDLQNLHQAEVSEMKNLSTILGIGDSGVLIPVGTGQAAQALSDFSPTRISGHPHPFNTRLSNPDANFDFLNKLTIGTMHIAPALLARILAEQNASKKKTRLDFQSLRDSILQTANGLCDHLGINGDTYDKTYGRSTVVPARLPNDDDWQLLFALNQTAMDLDHMAASTAVDDKRRLTAMQYIAGAASQSGIPFSVPNSAFAVPFPYGSTLEVLARRYLGDPQRWQEIATLNNLRTPWVDEEGFSLALLVNGRRNEVQIDLDSRIVPGQPVWLTSTTLGREKRYVQAVRPLGSTQMIVVLDGAADLDKYKTLDKTTISAFLPGTVNSQQIIYIPSEGIAEQKGLEPKPPEELVQDADALLQVGGTDWLLTSSGDLALTEDGDIRMAKGLANIIQGIKLAIETPAGTLIDHPEYGFGVPVGSSTADMTASEVLTAIKRTLKADPSISGVVSASVVKDGPTTAISVGLTVNGSNSLIPLSFRVRK